MRICEVCRVFPAAWAMQSFEPDGLPTFVYLGKQVWDFPFVRLCTHCKDAAQGPSETTTGLDIDHPRP